MSKEEYAKLYSQYIDQLLLVDKKDKRIAELEKNFLWLNARRNTPGIGDYVQFVLKELNISEGGADYSYNLIGNPLSKEDMEFIENGSISEGGADE